MTTIALLLALQDPEVATVTLDVRKMPMGKLLELVTKETGIPIELDADVKKDLDLEQELVTFKVDKLQVAGAMKLLFGPHDLRVTVVDKKKLRVSKP
ncbi:MAG TPA: hypothetical protein VF950_12595 [Planctomycetota bacterium]